MFQIRSHEPCRESLSQPTEDNMPYLKFDEGSLEPRHVRENLHLYVQTLTTKRGRRDKSAPHSAPKLDLPYSKVVAKGSSKRKQKRLYCQSLARALDRLQEEPSVYDESLRKPLPPLLSLPAELRVRAFSLQVATSADHFPATNPGTGP